jgi:hypothetical protein
VWLLAVPPCLLLLLSFHEISLAMRKIRSTLKKGTSYGALKWQEVCMPFFVGQIRGWRMRIVGAVRGQER